MQLWRSLQRGAGLGAAPAGLVATVGGFDGIHLGHRVLIDRTRELARARGLGAMLVTFEPLPKESLSPDDPVARLTSFRERWRILESDGPDIFCVLPFNARLRSLRATEFTSLLVHAGVRQLVIGHDFRAAYRGEADAGWFQRQGPALGLDVQIVEPVCSQGERVGSGIIRQALQAGDLDRAAGLLGRAYSMRGKVVRGEQLGRKLGFPTANLRLSRRRAPMDGIFAVRVRGLDGEAGQARHGVASLGTRPTVGGIRPLLEAHVFDFSGDLYGREIEVEFVARLREERRFDRIEAMVEQMHLDAAAARALLQVQQKMETTELG
jgi:riboflavin kinase/FMN adenylyltransferase